MKTQLASCAHKTVISNATPGSATLMASRESLVGQALQFPPETWPAEAVPSSGFWTGEITKWLKGKDLFECVCFEDRDLGRQYTTQWTHEQVLLLLATPRARQEVDHVATNESQEEASPRARVVSATIVANTAEGSNKPKCPSQARRKGKRKGAKQSGSQATGYVAQSKAAKQPRTKAAKNRWVGRKVWHYRAKWEVVAYLAPSAPKNTFSERAWFIQSGTGTKKLVTWATLETILVLHPSESRDSLQPTHAGTNATKSSRTCRVRAGMGQLPCFRDIEALPNVVVEDVVADQPNTSTPIRGRIPTAPQVDPYVLRKLFFKKEVWKAATSFRSTGHEGWIATEDRDGWHGTVIAYHAPRRKATQPYWEIVVTNAVGIEEHYKRFLWNPARSIGLRDHLVLLATETRDTITPSGPVQVVPRLVHNWTHVREEGCERTKCETPQLKKRKQSPLERQKAYRQNRAAEPRCLTLNKYLSTSGGVHSANAGDGATEPAVALCGARCKNMCSYFDTVARADIRTRTATMWAEGGRAALVKFIQNHTRIVPSIMHHSKGTPGMKCKYCCLPHVIPDPPTNHTFRKCKQREAAEQHFLRNAKPRMQMVLPIVPNGSCLRVCQAFFNNVVGVGANGKMVKSVHKKMRESLSPQDVERTRHSGSQGLCAERSQAIETTLGGLERVRSHYSSNPKNQTDAKYLVDVEENHFTLWVKTLHRERPLWVEMANEYHFFPSHDDVCHKAICPSGWGVCQPYLGRDLKFPTDWAGWQPKDGYDPAPDGWAGNIHKYHPPSSAWTCQNPWVGRVVRVPIHCEQHKPIRRSPGAPLDANRLWHPYGVLEYLTPDSEGNIYEERAWKLKSTHRDWVTSTFRVVVVRWEFLKLHVELLTSETMGVPQTEEGIADLRNDGLAPTRGEWIRSGVGRHKAHAHSWEPSVLGREPEPFWEATVQETNGQTRHIARLLWRTVRQLLVRRESQTLRSLHPYDMQERRAVLDQAPWITYRQHKAEVQKYDVKFGVLLVDTCETCAELQSKARDAGTDGDHDAVRQYEEDLTTHQMLADCSYKAKQFDMERCERSLERGEAIATHALLALQGQKHLARPDAIEFQSQDKGGNLKTPDNHRGACYYLSRLDVRPYDIYSHTTRRHTVHLWNESMSEQGANNVVSCEHEHHLMYPSGAGWLVKWQDSTVGQCNNLTMCRYLIHITDPKAGMHMYHRIDEKYPLKGHSYLPNDSNIAHMKRKRTRRQVVAGIQDWFKIVSTARKTNKNRVHLGKKSMMFDWKKFLNQFYVQQLRKDDDDEDVLITKHVWRNYGVGDEVDEHGVQQAVAHPGVVWLRKTLTGKIMGEDGTEVDEPWTKIPMRHSTWPKHIKDIVEFQLYTGPRTLTIKKIAALQKHASLLPLADRHQYEVLVQGREAEFLTLVNQVEGLDSLPIVTRTRATTASSINSEASSTNTPRVQLEEGALAEGM